MELLSLVGYGSNLVFEFSKVNYISSAGLHLLLDLYRRCEQYNARMILTGVSAQIKDILSMTGIGSGVLPIYDSLEDGLTALRSKPKPAGSKRHFDEEEEAPSAPESSFDIPKVEEKEEVNFSAFYPKQVTIEKWYTLLVYTYIPSALEAVREDAHKFEDEIGKIRFLRCH